MQQVANTVVGGHLTQVRDAKDVRMRGPVTASPPQAPSPGVDTAPEGQSGQYVNGVWVGGNLTQVDGVRRYHHRVTPDAAHAPWR